MEALNNLVQNEAWVGCSLEELAGERRPCVRPSFLRSFEKQGHGRRKRIAHRGIAVAPAEDNVVGQGVQNVSVEMQKIVEEAHASTARFCIAQEQLIEHVQAMHLYKALNQVIIVIAADVML